MRDEDALRRSRCPPHGDRQRPGVVAVEPWRVVEEAEQAAAGRRPEGPRYEVLVRMFLIDARHERRPGKIPGAPERREDIHLRVAWPAFRAALVTGVLPAARHLDEVVDAFRDVDARVVPMFLRVDGGGADDVFRHGFILLSRARRVIDGGVSFNRLPLA